MTRYILVQWPKSQLLMGHPRFHECLLVQDIDEHDEVGSSAYMCPEDLYDELFGVTNNRSLEEIKEMANTATESIRHCLSRILMDTSEDNPMEVDITLDGGAQGLSESEKNAIDSIYQVPTTGEVFIRFKHTQSYSYFDDLLLVDQLKILEELCTKN